MTGRIITGLSGNTLNFVEKKLLSYPHIGGIILFAHNIETDQQVKDLIDEIQHLRTQHQLPPCLISIDHEGGSVQRLRDDFFTKLPSAQNIGELFAQDALQAKQLITDIATVSAIELGSVGIDMLLGPVLDICPRNKKFKQKSRCYADNPDTIFTLTQQYITTLQNFGLTAAPKHFPGIANDITDTHINIATSNDRLEQIMSHDIQPYQQLIQQHSLSAIMLSHRIYYQVDEKPVSVSSKWLKEILKKQLGFSGVVITDCLQMISTRNLGSRLSEKILATLQNGCGLILSSQTPHGFYQEMYAALKDKDLIKELNKDKQSFQEKLTGLYKKNSRNYYKEKLKQAAYQSAKQRINQFNQKNLSAQTSLTGKKTSRARLITKKQINNKGTRNILSWSLLKKYQIKNLWRKTKIWLKNLI